MLGCGDPMAVDFNSRLDFSGHCSSSLSPLLSTSIYFAGDQSNISDKPIIPTLRSLHLFRLLFKIRQPAISIKSQTTEGSHFSSAFHTSGSNFIVFFLDLTKSGEDSQTPDVIIHLRRLCISDRYHLCIDQYRRPPKSSMAVLPKYSRLRSCLLRSLQQRLRSDSRVRYVSDRHHLCTDEHRRPPKIVVTSVSPIDSICSPQTTKELHGCGIIFTVPNYHEFGVFNISNPKVFARSLRSHFDVFSNLKFTYPIQRIFKRTQWKVSSFSFQFR
ncbi:hypothetical protein L1887_17824 [Cichorium endivia]|nr:hypothetical protein L1887_17824 [Cichorium endivia]